MSSSKNLDFEKTSFLNKSNSAFIEEMYLKFINKDADLPESWANYFEGIGEVLNVIAKEINGPSMIEFVVEQHDMVYPMVPAGANLDEMISRPVHEQFEDAEM